MKMVMACPWITLEAKRWYLTAAENGDEESRLPLALYYNHGRPGTKVDRSETLDFYRQRADAGDSESWYVLGAALAGFRTGYPT